MTPPITEAAVSWASTPDQALSAWRMDMPADLRSARIGFRVMRSL